MIPANIIFPWQGNHADIPSGWTRETTLDGKYPKAWGDSVSPNQTGGASAHTHTSPAHSHTLEDHTHSYILPSSGTTTAGMDPSKNMDVIIDTHTHTGVSGALSGGTTETTAVTYSSCSNDPPFYSVIFLRSNGGATIPNNLIAFFYDSSVPSNWYFCDGNNSTPDLRNRYLKGAAGGADAGTTGGSTTNSHNITHTHTTNSHFHMAADCNVSADQVGGESLDTAVHRYHIHSVTLNAATQAINQNTDTLFPSEIVEPAYIKLLPIQKKTGGVKAKGIIGLWLGSLATIPPGWFLCDGTNDTPDLRDKYIKCAGSTAEIGNMGGSNTHTHAAQPHFHSSSGSHSHTTSASEHVNSSSIRAGAATSTHRVTTSINHPSTTTETSSPNYSPANTTADSSNNEPPFRTVAYIQFQKEIYGGSALLNFI